MKTGNAFSWHTTGNPDKLSTLLIYTWEQKSHFHHCPLFAFDHITQILPFISPLSLIPHVMIMADILISTAFWYLHASSTLNFDSRLTAVPCSATPPSLPPLRNKSHLCYKPYRTYYSAYSIPHARVIQTAFGHCACFQHNYKDTHPSIQAAVGRGSQHVEPMQNRCRSSCDPHFFFLFQIQILRGAYS